MSAVELLKADHEKNDMPEKRSSLIQSKAVWGRRSAIALLFKYHKLRPVMIREQERFRISIYNFLMKKLGGLLLQVFVALFPLMISLSVSAQTPFTTDDADVTEKGKLHFELLNETDLLQKSLNPSLRQDSAITRFAYGVGKNMEIGIDIPILAIFNARGTIPSHPFGLSDLGAHVKVKFREEKDESRIPAVAVAFAIRLPTGNSSNSLGSGVTNYQLYGIAQKSVTKKTKLRANAGILFAGNTVIGALGVRTTGGKLFSAGGSAVREFSEKLKLGIELTGVASSNFQLSKGQLQSTLGGNYNLKKNFAVDFGLIIGRFPASPRVGGLIGFTYDF